MIGWVIAECHRPASNPAHGFIDRCADHYAMETYDCFLFNFMFWSIAPVDCLMGPGGRFKPVTVQANTYGDGNFFDSCCVP